MSFLQSNAWEQFQRALGRVTARIDGQLAIRYTTPVGAYWYLPRPSVLNSEALISHGRGDRSAFIRVDPDISSPIPHSSLPVRPIAPTQPQDSLVLPLAASTDELMASFHEKTRYNIRVAQRHELMIEESTDPEHRAMTAFLQFARRTADRQAFRYHPDAYYKTMLRVLNEPNDEGISASALVAHKDNGPAAAMIVLWTPTTAYYLHGASWYERRKLMAPHLLQWAAIQRAKERGCAHYDFWGIAPLNAERELVNANHAWSGITRFKLGFGGEVVHYPDSFDLVVQPAAYTIYTMGRRLRRSLPF